MEVYRSGGYVKKSGYFLSRLSFFDEGGHLNFPRRQTEVRGGQIPQEGRYDVI